MANYIQPPPNCLVGCIKDFLGKSGALKTEIDTHVLMPWVEVSVSQKPASSNIAASTLAVAGRAILAVGKAALAAVGGVPPPQASVPIAVANTSSRNTKACVKSFQFGTSNGLGCNIEIIDEEGGNFATFFNKLLTGNVDAFNRTLLNVRWGWAVQGCAVPGATYSARGTGCNVESSALMTKIHTLIINNIRTSLSNGVFTFKIEGTDMTLPLMNSRTSYWGGTDGNPMSVIQAVTEMLAEFGVKVKFIEKTANGQTVFPQWLADTAGAALPVGGGLVGGAGAVAPGAGGFAAGAGNGGGGGLVGGAGAVSNLTGAGARASAAASGGIISRWNALNLNPLQVARNWVNTIVTSKKKGLTMFWDSCASNTLVFMVYTGPTCDSTFDSKSTGLNLGTYVVNGKCSPVIEFNPELKFNPGTLQILTGGISGDTGAPYMRRTVGPEQCLADKMPNAKNAGLLNFQFIYEAILRNYLKRSNIIGNQKLMTHNHANIPADPIEAELRIQGDPNYDDTIFYTGSFIGIVFVNPFYLTPSGKNNCVWLASPPCNDYFTNTNWMIRGVFHEIREGSYTTTLKLHLPTPGIDIARSAPLGAMQGAPVIP